MFTTRGRRSHEEAHDLDKVSIPPTADALQDADRLLGIISLKDLLRFMRLKVDLERGTETD